MAASPQHATLVAATVSTFTFDFDFESVEVANVDGVASVYFTTDGTTPVAAATGTNVIGAAIQRLEVGVAGTGVTVVKVISAGIPKVSVRGTGAARPIA